MKFSKRVGDYSLLGRWFDPSLSSHLCSQIIKRFGVLYFWIQLVKDFEFRTFMRIHSSQRLQISLSLLAVTLAGRRVCHGLLLQWVPQQKLNAYKVFDCPISY